ncbi:diguanylate cyclase [Arenimonas fontis]|uniref:diguanylate cyclase n=1 Tax=Arenimonas fontis TaxID=2608255 RepID=A0A5B2ZB36_9GAMM|nr:diguanylate cyclase [Arenimonas fontis]KAA2284480.1 diguanylate cyclase [Arenimonas fontis]
MASDTPPRPATAAHGATGRNRLPWRVYPLRALGMGLAFLPMYAVLRELESPPAVWAWAAFSAFVWPHLAFALAARAAEPDRAEIRNLMLDSMIAGSWVPLLHFNLLPSAVLVTVATADKINSGVRGLWLRSLPAMLAALVFTGLAYGWYVQPESSLPVILACLPLMTIHTLAVSANLYRLVRKLQRQNLLLDRISRQDDLTGLHSRAHWLAEAEQLLREHQESGRPATLTFLDVHHFKATNDRYGHAVGDDVLRGIAGQIRAHLPEGGHAGRLGGDEFALALPYGLPGAEALAGTLRVAVETLEFPCHPGLRCSISLGLAEPPGAGLGLREWMEAADRALYEAKQAGRNRTAGARPRA